MLSLLFLISSGLVWAKKPMSPLDVVLQSSTEPVASARLDIVATISSRVALADVEVVLTLPKGVEILSGKTSEVLKIEAGSYVDLHYTLQLPESLSGAISIKVKARHGQAITYSARDFLPLAAGKRGVRANGRPPYVIKEQNGRRLREYTLP